MPVLWCLIWFCLQVVAQDTQCGSSPGCQKYEADRAKLVQLSRSQSFDSGIVLTDTEKQANQVLIHLRDDFRSMYNPRLQYNPQQKVIEGSLLFSVLDRMPKGAILHLHALGTIDLSVKALTRDDCYVCYSDKFLTDGMQLGFSANGPPVAVQNASAWAKCTSQPSDFESRVRGAMLFTSPPASSVSKTAMWELFDSTIAFTTTPLLYLPHWQDVACQALEAWAKGGTRHIELRQNLEGAFRGADGTILPPDTLIDTYLGNVNNCSSGVDSISFIIALRRDADEPTMRAAVQETIRLQKKYGNAVILGFDIDSEEDRFHSLSFYADLFVQSGLKFFFHAGETRNNLHSEDNTFSALALNSSRIGHGFSLRDHPALAEVMKSRQTGLEVCPLSNQVLRLVAGLDDHPAYGFAAAGVPLSISPDDPIIYGYSSSTADWTAITGAWNLTLPFLKQACKNSLTTAAGPANTPEAMAQWASEWDLWVEWLASADL